MFKLLRIEAINFDQALADTNQLSVVRGGGLAMREAISSLWSCLEKLNEGAGSSDHGRIGIQKVSVGGSIGLFIFDDEILDSHALEEAVSVALSGSEVQFNNNGSEWNDFVECFRSTEAGKLCPYFCFALASAEIESECSAISDIDFESFESANEHALTKIRLAQLRQPNLSILDKSSKRICPWDGRRPAARSSSESGDGSGGLALSAPVEARYRFGRHAKRNSAPSRFFSNEISKASRAPAESSDHHFELMKGSFELLLESGAAGGSEGNGIFPNDFGELCDGWGDHRTAGKLAVIYADGNKFSKIMRKGVKSVEDYKAWDEMLQRERGRFLLELLHWLSEKRDPDKPIPLEILLWGGDEVMYVLPAALALEGVAKFFEFNAGLRWPLEDGEILTQSLGLVICSQKTPIHRIKDLASALGEHVKTALGEKPDDQRNAWHYAILESVDTPFDLPAFFESRYGSLAQSLTPLLPSNLDFDKQLQGAAELAERIPRAQLHMVARELSENPGSKTALGRFEHVTDQKSEDLSELIENILPTLSSEPKQDQTGNAQAWNFVHWAELLDYWPLNPISSLTEKSDNALGRTAQ